MKISTLIINKNEEAFIKDCLESVKWASEIIILDGGSTDKSLEIARDYGARVVSQKGQDFASWRNQLLAEAKGEWLLYLDCDERIPPLLKNEIEAMIAQKDDKIGAYAIARRNFLLGRELKHGGWSPDYVERLFLREKLAQWSGKLHERPVYEGELKYLKNAMIHLQPEKIEPALEKSIKWSDVEANLLFQSQHPPVVWWRVFRMGLTTLFDRLIKKQGFRDGTEGWIESVYQAFHTMIVYLKLWEKQQATKK